MLYLHITLHTSIYTPVELKNKPEMYSPRAYADNIITSNAYIYMSPYGGHVRPAIGRIHMPPPWMS